ncbi:unnamed protein product [Closterium sp. NIES-64]|nr:unnamed protein product [Closterium sp. NIES-64]
MIKLLCFVCSCPSAPLLSSDPTYLTFALFQSIGRGRTCSPSLSTISAAASPTAASASVLRTSSLHPWGWQGLRVPGRIELGRGVGLHPGTGLGGGFQGTGVAGAGAGVGRGRGLRRAGSLGVVAAVSGAGASGGGGDSSGSTSQWKAGSSKSKAASSASGSTGKAAGGAKKAKAAKKRSQGTSAAAAADVDKDWDPITELLERVPNRVEPQVRVNGQLMSLKEAEARAVPAPIRALNALEEGIESAREAALGKLAEVLGGVDKEVIIEEGSDEEGVAAEGREGKEGKQSQQGFSSGADATQQANPVYLKDLLREFKGELVVPEEAFAPRVVETTAFDRALADAPPMSAAEFLGFAEKKQVALVTSRGLKRRDGRFEYWDVLVELKEVPGEPALQTNTWRLKVDSQSVPAVLAAYKGPQKEVETVYSTFVEVPSAKPLPAASTISGRIFLECSILAAILQSFLSALIASSTAALLLASSAVLFIVRSVLWPLAKPLLTPVVWVVAAVAKQIAAVLTATWASLFAPGGASLFGFLQLQLAAMFGSGGIAAGVTGSAATASGDAITDVAVDLARDIFIGKLKSSAKAVGMMVFVVLFMAAGAKFTLNRRTRDYTKWDIWQAIEFGQSKPQARVEGSTGVKFEDVAGIDETVQELQELVEYLKDPQRFNLMGTKPPHGVLLEGPPGCGKTLLAKAIAGEAGVPFYQMAGSEFAEVLVGVGAARVRDLFKRAKVNKPAVVFIDEIDALGAARSSAGGDEGADAGVTERETTLNQLLIELDGFDTGQGVVFIGATNRMDMLDAALLRPGRFDRKITIVPPGSKGRAEVLKVHAKKVKMSPHVDLDTIAGNLAGWSGAQLANLLQEAALVAVRRGAGEIEDEDLYTAADRLTLGTPRERWGAEQGKHPMLVRRMAVHEAGLALTALLLIEYDDAQVEPPQRLSIVPRGETPSWTVFNRIDDEAYLFEKRRTLLHRLQVLLGGRAAEEVVWGRDSSTYSQRHVADASWMAYKFVSIWHMAGKVLPRGIPPAWKRRSTASGPSLGFEGSLYADYGFTGGKISDHADDVAADMAHSLLDEAYAATWQLLADHKAALVKAVNVLMAKGEIQGSDLDIILDAYPAGTPVQVVETEAAPGELPEAFAGHSGDTESEGEEEDGRRRRRREEGVEVRKVEGQFRSVLGGILEEKGKEEKVEEEREGVRGAEVSGKDAGVGKDKEEGKKVEGLSSEASEGEREDGEDEEWGEEELDEDEDWAEEDSDEDEDERLILEAMDRKAGAVGGSGEEGSVMEKSGEGRGGEDVKAAEFQTVERGAEVAGLGAVSGEGLGGGDTSEVKAVAKKTQAEGVARQVGQVGQDGVKAQGGAESNGTLGKRKGDEKLGAGDSARDAGETGDGLTLVRPNGKQAEAE